MRCTYNILHVLRVYTIFVKIVDNAMQPSYSVYRLEAPTETVMVRVRNGMEAQLSKVKRVTTAVRIDLDLLQWIRAYAREERLTVSDVLRRLILVLKRDLDKSSESHLKQDSGRGP